MKKLLLLNLLLALTFVTTSLKAADDDVFTAEVQVIRNGETSTTLMRFQVISEADKTCKTYAYSDEINFSPAINQNFTGKVIIPETIDGYTIVSIGKSSFKGCSLTGLKLPETLLCIETRAFDECSISDITFPETNITIEEYAFAGSDIKNIYNLKATLSPWAFTWCHFLESASIDCDSIPLGCFNDCTHLTSVEFRSPVVSVGNGAFNNCLSLTSFSFLAGLKSIDAAFTKCSNLETVFLPSSLDSISTSAFSECNKLNNVIIASETPPAITGSDDSFRNLSSTAVLTVPDGTKYNSAPWTGFSEIKSFLPTSERTSIFYNLGSYGWGIPVYTSDPNKVLNLTVDGKPMTPTFYGTDVIVSNDPKYVPLEVSYLLRTDEGLKPNIIHYDFIDYGFSIDGKQMTSRDFYNVPGVVSGNAYLRDEIYAVRWKNEPTLVLDNARLIWNSGLNLPTGQLTIKVIGNSSISVPNGIGFDLDPGTYTTIEGGGKLYISADYPIETFVVTYLTIQDNTTVLAHGRSQGYRDNDGAIFTIKDGATFCAYGETGSPIQLDSNPITFGSGIDVRYPVGAYMGSWGVLNADGTAVTKDWVVIGPDNQATQDLITGVASPKSSPEGNDFIYNLAGQRLSKPQKGINIVGGKKVLIK